MSSPKKSSITAFFQPSSPTKQTRTIIDDTALQMISKGVSATTSKKRKHPAPESNGPSPKKKKLDTKQQMSLDFGQKNLEVTCSGCGMLYCPGAEADEILHKKFHREHKKPGWKGISHLKTIDSDTYIIVVSQESPEATKPKFKSIRETIDNELNFTVSDRKPVEEKTYLYIHKKKVAGCLVVEHIKEAFKIQEPEPVLTSSVGDTLSQGSTVVCGKEPHVAKVGISRIWVAQSERKSGIATKLVDVMRTDYIFGSVVPKTQIALSQPTTDGRSFACKYFGKNDFLVYDFLAT